MSDYQYMQRCIELAKRGRGKVGINPLVGAALVRDDKIIAEAWHEEFGKAHAERSILENLEGEIQPSDTLYINLEPCCHKGKTPPCTDIIIERGVKNVVYGMEDSNPIVAGFGLQQLQKAGIIVRGPVLRAQCEWLNRGFMSVVRKGRPWITLKQAQTVDGRIANEDGSFLKITSEEQDRWSHQNLRATHDAILVGVQTIITDDPQLTIRHVDAAYQPLRIVLDPEGRMPVEARVVGEGTVIVTKEVKELKDVKELNKRGVTIIKVPVGNGHFVWDALWDALITPSGDFHGISGILVEGGPKTWEAFREAGVVDEEVILVGQQ